MKKIFYFLLAMAFFVACKPDEEEPIASVDYSHGVFIVNEGSFQNNNASITHISTTGTITNDVFLKVNGAELGDVLQSFEVMGNNGYAVLNNSQNVVVVDMSTMKQKTSITGADYPRYIHNTGNGRAYLTNGSWTGDVKVIDTGSNSIVASIPVGNGPERMVQYGDYVFVCNYAFGGDNRVSVINVTTDAVVEDIIVGDGPSDAVVDSNGDVWVLCSGNTLYDDQWNVIGHTEAKIYRINGTSLDIEESLSVGILGDHPRNLEMSPGGETLYYDNNGIYAFSASSFDLPGNKIIEEVRTSIDVNPSTGEIWCAGISDYVSPSLVYRYSSTGTLLGTYTTGIASTSVRFN